MADIFHALIPLPGAAEVQGEREGHGGADVGAVRHAGEDPAPGEQPERRDPHQAGPLLGAGGRQAAAGDSPR